MKKKDLKTIFQPKYKENYTKYFMFILGVLLVIIFLFYPVIMIYEDGIPPVKDGDARWFVSNNEVFFDSIKVYTFIPVTGGSLFVGGNSQTSDSGEKDSIQTSISTMKRVQINSFLLEEHEFLNCFGIV